MRRIFAVALITGALGGCTQVAGGGDYDLAEYSITGPALLEAGSQSLTISNSGEFPHTVVITDTGGAVMAATSLIQPGEAVQLDVDLESGHRYSFTCRIVAQTGEGQLVDHFEEGMATTVEVAG